MGIAHEMLQDEHGIEAAVSDLDLGNDRNDPDSGSKDENSTQNMDIQLRSQSQSETSQSSSDRRNVYVKDKNGRF